MLNEAKMFFNYDYVHIRQICFYTEIEYIADREFMVSTESFIKGCPFAFLSYQIITHRSET